MLRGIVLIVLMLVASVSFAGHPTAHMHRPIRPTPAKVSHTKVPKAPKSTVKTVEKVVVVGRYIIVITDPSGSTTLAPVPVPGWR